MQKKLMISLDEQIYLGLSRLAEKNKINHFIEDLLRQYLFNFEMNEGYKRMAADTERETEAIDWAEATIGDISDETW